jgi:hypothetical protein
MQLCCVTVTSKKYSRIKCLAFTAAQITIYGRLFSLLNTVWVFFSPEHNISGMTAAIAMNKTLLREAVFRMYESNAHKLSFFSLYLQQTPHSQTCDCMDACEDLYASVDTDLVLMFLALKSTFVMILSEFTQLMEDFITSSV